MVRSRRRKRRRRRRKAVLSVAPTFFHLLHVAVAPNPVIHLLPVGLLAAAQHRQRAARLLHHVHDAVQELQWDKTEDELQHLLKVINEQEEKFPCLPHM